MLAKVSISRCPQVQFVSQIVKNKAVSPNTSVTSNVPKSHQEVALRKAQGGEKVPMRKYKSGFPKTPCYLLSTAY